MIQLLEQAAKLTRAARAVNNLAATCDDNTTNKEYYYLAAASTFLQVEQLLKQGAEAAAKAATANIEHADEACAKRKESKKS